MTGSREKMQMIKETGPVQRASERRGGGRRGVLAVIGVAALASRAAVRYP
jgi:hypothetical protein